LKTISVVSVFGVVLGAWYMLWLVERLFFGPLREPALDHGDGHATPAASHAPVAHAHDAHAHDAHAHGGHDDHGHAGPSPLPPSSVRDLSKREVLCLAPLVVFMFWIGLDPEFFTSRMSATLDPIALSSSERFERYHSGGGASPAAGQAAAERPDEPQARDRATSGSVPEVARVD
jgi:NADH:ubiquinone oxidoreductase subunit 4 (subunit M)